MRYALFLVIILLLSACSQPDPYEKSMRSGKDALIEMKYEEAVRQFEVALIEKPQDEDAKILLEQARTRLEVEDTKLVLGEYVDSMGSIPQEYQEILSFYTSLKVERSVISTSDLKNMEIIKELREYAEEVINKYSDQPHLIEVHGYLISSMEKLLGEIESPVGIFSKYTYDAAKTNYNEYMNMIKELGK